MSNTETPSLPGKQMFWIGLLFFVIGIAVLIGAIYVTMSNAKKLDSYVKTNAVVVDHAYSGTSDNGNPMYSEIVEYTVNGKTYTAKSNSSSNSPKNIGSTVEIAYNPYNPSQCIFVANNIIISVIMFILGTVFPLAGGALTVKYILSARKFRRAQAEEYGYED